MEGGRVERGRATWPELLVVFVVSMGLAMAVFHEAWAHPMTTQVGGAGDADEYSWFLAWMPFALGHGLDPLISHYVNAPGGINLMWNTSVLLPSFLVSPVTVIFGAAFSYNLLITLGPALSCTFAYLAFRRWTDPAPAMAGALVFGYSPAMISQSAGHLAQTLVMSAPLFLVLLDRLLVVQAGPAWRDGLLLGLLAWAQLLTGEEVLAMEAVTAAIAVVVLCAIARRLVRPHFPYAWRGGVVAAVTFAVLALPFLAVQELGPYKVQDVHPPDVYVNEFLNFFVPTNITKFAPAAALRLAAHFTGNGSEQGGYLGIPLIIFLAFALYLARHRLATWVALAAGGSAGILSLGPRFHFRSHSSYFPMPEDVLAHLPLFHNFLPDRFSTMMTLGAGWLLALGLNELKALPRPVMAGGWAVGLLGLVALVPITDFPAAGSPMYTAFSTGLACPQGGPRISAGLPRVALLIPVIDEMDLRWQAESNFCFVMPSATGMTGTNTGDVKNRGILFSLGNPGQPMLPTTAALREQAAQEIRQLRITEIVVAPEYPAVPIWDPQGQAEAVAWAQWLLGRPPVQSKDPYISYIWKNLPPVNEIASGHFGAASGQA